MENMPVYAPIGDSFQQIGGDCPEGWIVMVGIRPEVGYLAKSDGTWEEPKKEQVASVSRRQGRLALLNAGLLDAVESYIEHIEDPIRKRTAQIEYESNTWEIDNEFINYMWGMLNGTPEELKDIFNTASTL